MSYSVLYQQGTPEECDEQALQDMRGYLSEKQWDAVMRIVGHIEAGKGTIDTLNLSLGFAGVSGYPFHAFCRKYLLQQYIEWRTTGECATPVDERGFAEGERTIVVRECGRLRP